MIRLIYTWILVVLAADILIRVKHLGGRIPSPNTEQRRYSVHKGQPLRGHIFVLFAGIKSVKLVAILTVAVVASAHKDLS